MENKISPLAREIADDALRMENDVNGNPRYYVACYCFVGANGKMFRPFGAVKYRGKRYGQGWVFQSYNLPADIQRAIDFS